jgi:glutamine amidotransferase
LCELLGLSFAKPISADFSLREFEHHDEENPDGWGLAWYPDRSLAIVKEPVEWGQSKYSGFLETYHGLCSQLYIGHVRHKTTGGPPVHADTHPFGRELDGREYCFAHNGTLAGPYWELPLGRYKPIGTTDSEHLFCHLLEEISQLEGALANPESWTWLHDKLYGLNRWGKLNCLLSDGKRLFCYHDAAGWKGLTIREVFIQDLNKRSFGDPGMRFNLESPSLVNHGHVVATRPLSPTGWIPFEAGELIVLEAGMVRFSSQNPVAQVSVPIPL